MYSKLRDGTRVVHGLLAQDRSPLYFQVGVAAKGLISNSSAAVIDRPRNPRLVDYELKVEDRDSNHLGFFEAAKLAHIYAESYAAGTMPFDITPWEHRREQIVLFRLLI